jgi:hypothetical protein
MLFPGVIAPQSTSPCLIVHSESEYTSKFIVGVGVGNEDESGATVDDGDQSGVAIGSGDQLGVRIGDGNGEGEEERIGGEDGKGVTVDDGDKYGVRIGDGNGEGVTVDDGDQSGVRIGDGNGEGVTVDDGDKYGERVASKLDVLCVAVNAPNVVIVNIMPVNASAIIIDLVKCGFANVLASPKAQCIES